MSKLIYKTDEERRDAVRATKLRYSQSENGKKKMAEYYRRPEVMAAVKARAAVWKNKAENKDKVVSCKLNWRYGINISKYNQMLSAQNGGCAICNEVNKNGRRLHVDHDHETGEIRGLLCHGCNAALGLLKENLGVVLGMAEYIRRHSK